MGFWTDLAAMFTPKPVTPPPARPAPVTPPKPISTGKKAAGGAAIAAAVAMVASFEGLRQVAYLDIGGVPTVCYGETKGVTRADVGRTRYTEAECRDMLRVRVAEFNSGIRGCVTAPMRASREAALTSFAYNVGVRAACGSTAVRLLNAGQDRDGCAALMRWNKVAGVEVRGLTARRALERDRCLKNED
jgi:lysozyme